MLILFLRSVILYVLVFVVIRLTGKRQISDLQPFDLVITLLMAELATKPIENPTVPLAYGLVPILALFLIQQLVAYVSMKSERVRSVVCGKSMILIAKGVVQEEVMRQGYYTLNDLMEQLRSKDVFDISDVEYAILETDGEISVLLKGPKQQPALEDLQLAPHNAEPAHMLILDGKVHERALQQVGYSMQWLNKQLKKADVSNSKDVFFASLSPDGTLHVQEKQKTGGKFHFVQTGEKQHG